MKRESVNTFSGGLTYDINPITTPNNVLTDGVNATFLTFNGDEMALQNDAGNTKILSYYGESNKEIYDKSKEYYKNALVVQDDKLYYCKEDGVTGTFDILKWQEVEDSVKLSDGFKPIGLKEHGGILYIVSHRKTKESEESEEFDEFEIGSYPSPGYKKAGITTNTTAVDVVEKGELIEPIEPIEQFNVVHRLGEFIQLSNSEVFPGDPYRITFTFPEGIVNNLTRDGARKFYTFEFYLKPKEGDFIALKDIKTTDSLTPFYSEGLAFVPNNGSGKLFIKFELEDIDEFTQYSEIDGIPYYFPRLEFNEGKTFIEFDYFNVKHGSKIKLDAIDMEYTLINSQTGETTETTGETPKEFKPELAAISEEKFVCKDEGNNFFRIQTPDTSRILEYKFTPKNNLYNIVFNNHIIKKSIDLSIDPLLWGNYLTYGEAEKGNFYFQSPDSGDLLIFRNMNTRNTFLVRYNDWLTSSPDYFDGWDTNLNNYSRIEVAYNNVTNRRWYSSSSQKINYTLDFNYKDFTTSIFAEREIYVKFHYRRSAFKDDMLEKYELRNEAGDWIEPVWWNTVTGGGFDTEDYGADRAVFLDENDKVVAIAKRTLPDVGWGEWEPQDSYRYGYFLSRAITADGPKRLKINGSTVHLDNVCSPGEFTFSGTYTGGESVLINSIELSHVSSTGSSIPESYVGVISLRQYISVHNKGREIILMKKATANFEGIVKPTTYDFKEAVLNDSANLITSPDGLTERQSNIVFEGRAQKRYVLSNKSNTKSIPTTLTVGDTYTLAFYIIAEGVSTINITILGKSYSINYALDSGILKATVTSFNGGLYQQTHNHDVVNGLYVNNTPIFHNGRYYSYVKYTFNYQTSENSNLILSTGNTFEIAELTLKRGIILPQAVQVYQDMLYVKRVPGWKNTMYALPAAEVDNNILGKLYIPNTNYEIRGVLPYGL